MRCPECGSEELEPYSENSTRLLICIECGAGFEEEE
jgi:transcription initiation factor TFIIIB Brf1 subunit/transcription initiation factor TFIIB